MDIARGLALLSVAFALPIALFVWSDSPVLAFALALLVAPLPGIVVGSVLRRTSGAGRSDDAR